MPASTFYQQHGAPVPPSPVPSQTGSRKYSSVADMKRRKANNMPQNQQHLDYPYESTSTSTFDPQYLKSFSSQPDLTTRVDIEPTPDYDDDDDFQQPNDYDDDQHEHVNVGIRRNESFSSHRRISTDGQLFAAQSARSKSLARPSTPPPPPPLPQQQESRQNGTSELCFHT
jgi:hypothetical protein